MNQSLARFETGSRTAARWLIVTALSTLIYSRIGPYYYEQTGAGWSGFVRMICDWLNAQSGSDWTRNIREVDPFFTTYLATLAFFESRILSESPMGFSRGRKWFWISVLGWVVWQVLFHKWQSQLHEPPFWKGPLLYSGCVHLPQALLLLTWSPRGLLWLPVAAGMNAGLLLLPGVSSLIVAFMAEAALMGWIVAAGKDRHTSSHDRLLAEKDVQDSSTPPDQLAAEADLKLRKCRPLDDPCLVAKRLFQNGLVIVVILSFISLTAGFTTDAALIHGAATVCLWLLLNMMLPGLRQPLVYVIRTFRRDEETQDIRLLIAAAVGPGGRVMGIRAPRRRTGLFARIFGDMFVVLRYAGSPYCDLVASDRNWLARVVSTLHLRKVPLALIDLRDMSDNVAQELIATVKLMGLGRCGFIIDSSLPHAKWLNRLHQWSLHEAGRESVTFVHAPADSPEEERRFVDEIQTLLKKAQQKKTPSPHAAVRYVEGIVPKSHWATYWSETSWAALLLYSPLSVVLLNITLTPLAAGHPDSHAVLFWLVDMLLKLILVVYCSRAFLRLLDSRRLGARLVPERSWGVGGAIALCLATGIFQGLDMSSRMKSLPLGAAFYSEPFRLDESAARRFNSAADFEVNLNDAKFLWDTFRAQQARAMLALLAQKDLSDVERKRLDETRTNWKTTDERCVGLGCLAGLCFLGLALQKRRLSSLTNTTASPTPS